MQRIPFTQPRMKEAGFTTVSPDIYAKQPTQGIFNKEHNASSDFVRPVQEIPFYSKVGRTPSSVHPVQHFQQAQNLKGLDQFSPFGQSNQNQDFSGSKPLPPYGQSMQNQTFVGPNPTSPFSPSNQGPNSNGPDRSSPFRQPKQKIMYNSLHQSSSLSQPEQRPGMVHVPSFGQQDQDLIYIQQKSTRQHKQSDPSNQSFYSSDTTWVYSSSVTTPIKSGPYQQPMPNSHEIEDTRNWKPEIYSNEDEAFNQGTVMKNSIPGGLPSLYTEVHSPPVRNNGVNTYNERYDMIHSSNAPSQQLSHSSQSLHNFNYHEMSVPGGQYPRHAFNASHGGYPDNESFYGYQKLDRRPQGYPKDSGFGSMPHELPMIYERSNSNDGMIGLNQSRFDSQTVKPSQMNMPSPPQGACVNLWGCIEMHVNLGFENAKSGGNGLLFTL